MKTQINLAVIFLMMGAVMFSGCAGKVSDSIPAGTITGLNLKNYTARLAGTRYISGIGYPTVGTRNATLQVSSNANVNGSYHIEDTLVSIGISGSYSSWGKYKSLADGLYLIDPTISFKAVNYPVLTGGTNSINIYGQPITVTVIGYENLTTTMGTLYCAKIKYVFTNGEMIQWVNEQHFTVMQETYMNGVLDQRIYVISDNL